MITARLLTLAWVIAPLPAWIPQPSGDSNCSFLLVINHVRHIDAQVLSEGRPAGEAGLAEELAV